VTVPVAPRVVTFGEIMLRLSPGPVERLLQSPTLSATFGGGEANVAVSLAHFGLESVYVTALPAHAIGDAAVRALRAEGVRTDFIVRSGQRVGIYFAETGASQRASTVIYDRAHSSISELAADAIQWSGVLTGAAWFHVTGITPALGANAAESTRRAIEAARAAGARVSFDLNFRRKLWTEAEAQRVVAPLLRQVDVLVANEEDLQSVLGIHVAGADVASGRLAHEGFRDAAERVTRDFGPRLVAITLRESFSASDNGWSGLLWDADRGQMITSQRYDIRVVDRIGAGDSFAAGLIYGLIRGRSPEKTLRFAVAASALKHTIPGDFNRVSVEEVDRLAGGDASGRVQR
jgi:2-dehydro-3-deoxygluconokinase